MQVPTERLYSYQKVYNIDNQECNKSYLFRGKVYDCSLEIAMELIGGKWKTMMLFNLKNGAVRSGDLQRKLKGITNKMFTQTARELEAVGLIERIVYPVIPPKVEYQLTAMGISVTPIIEQLAAWGKSVCD